MSSQSHCAVDIIGNCIDVGTKQRGGKGRRRASPCGKRSVARDASAHVIWASRLEPVLIRAKRWSGLFSAREAKAELQILMPEMHAFICLGTILYGGDADYDCRLRSPHISKFVDG